MTESLKIEVKKQTNTYTYICRIEQVLVTSSETKTARSNYPSGSTGY